MNPLDIERNITAVANGKHSAVDHVEILGHPVRDIQNDTICHTYIVRSGLSETSVNCLMNLFPVKFIGDVEKFTHTVLGVIHYIIIGRNSNSD